MKILLLVCAGFLLFAIANLPIGYYTILRIIVTVGSISIILKEFDNKFDFWIISFGLTAIIFNPIFPVYLNSKSSWLFIDVIAAILFLIKAFKLRPIKNF